MSSKTQDKIYETFAAVAGAHSGSQHWMIDASERIAKPGASTGGQIRTAKSVKWPAASTTATSSKVASPTSTAASTATSSGQSMASSVLQSVFQSVPLVSAATGASSGSSGGGIGGTIESIASTVLKSGLGMVPLIGGLLGLFGGGDSTATPTLTKYSMPASIGFEGADIGSSSGDADYDQMGLPRVYGADGMGSPAGSYGWPTGTSGSGGTSPTSFSGSGGVVPGQAASGTSGSSSTGNAPAPQITVNVQAMDARSFLDRSSDIAAAVRDAMLNLNSINDVVNNL